VRAARLSLACAATVTVFLAIMPFARIPSWTFAQLNGDERSVFIDRLNSGDMFFSGTPAFPTFGPVRYSVGQGSVTGWAIHVDLWFVITLFVILDAGLVGYVCLDIWQSRARIRGACATCGYDLRATPDRCPECGTKTAMGEV
jgi:hypothetical protein